jgi:hypothetical protein
MMLRDFTKTVQQQKAIEYLLQNDAVFRSVAYRMSTGTPAEAAWVALECTQTLLDKVKNIAPQMYVSDKEKREGYSVCPDPSQRASKTEF